MAAGNLLELQSLPLFPSSKTLRSLPPSQYASLVNQISATLQQVVSLPNDKLAKASHRDFLASYAKDHACGILSTLVYADAEQEKPGAQETAIRKYVLVLAERLASAPNAGGIDLRVMLDLTIVYGAKNSTRMRKLFAAALKSRPAIEVELKDGGVEAFERLLTASDSGLHGIRKTAYCLSCLLQCSPPEILRLFSRSKQFSIALARSYDARLSSVAASYGGINLQAAAADAGGWERQWIESKVALIDSFHLVFKQILWEAHTDTNFEFAFDLLFSLLNLPAVSTHNGEMTPFLNRSLLADYQQAYSLSSTMTSVLADLDDPRLDLLAATLKLYDEENVPASDQTGVLKLVLRSSGVPPGVDNRGGGNTKGKARAAVQDVDNEADAYLDMAVTQVLDFIPGQQPDYVRALLSLSQYGGNPERVIGALLEGDAPAAGTFDTGAVSTTETLRYPEPRAFGYTNDRRNIFDDDEMNLANVTVGKRATDADVVLKDRSFIAQMKDDILRRVEQALDESEDEVDPVQRPRIVAYEEDEYISMERVAQVAGDGEGSGDDDTESEEDTPKRPSPETICELAYIRDPSLFDRDATTRRSKARADLKAQTGWADEQIEGWRIMLERNPKKDKILMKHEFAGNRAPSAQWGMHTSGSSGSGPAPTAPRGGPGRGGRGGGRGRGGGGVGGDGSDARERVWKDKNKARQGNHNRKRGHDKKMARGAAPPA